MKIINFDILFLREPPSKEVLDFRWQVLGRGRCKLLLVVQRFTVCTEQKSTAEVNQLKRQNLFAFFVIVNYDVVGF